MLCWLEVWWWNTTGGGGWWIRTGWHSLPVSRTVTHTLTHVPAPIAHPRHNDFSIIITTSLLICYSNSLFLYIQLCHESLLLNYFPKFHFYWKRHWYDQSSCRIRGDLQPWTEGDLVAICQVPSLDSCSVNTKCGWCLYCDQINRNQPSKPQVSEIQIHVSQWISMHTTCRPHIFIINMFLSKLIITSAGGGLGSGSLEQTIVVVESKMTCCEDDGETQYYGSKYQ